MFKASKLIKRISTSKGREITIEYVTETDAWKRPILATKVQTDFAAIAEKNKDALREDTVKVAMKEAEHPSKSDAQSHYSVFELDKDDKVVAAKHWYK
ncbi:hypothetical protein KC338_g8630 [Hortaea werneckii]|nr:hypothetical protein KC323_g9573 [Hortaea werneckii]KAI6855997.1 hypothetical protein KC338_g8630 [Hortaea werneckii]